MYHYHSKTISWLTNRHSHSNRITPLTAALTRRTLNTMIESVLPQGPPDPHLSDDHRRTDDLYWTTKLKNRVCGSSSEFPSRRPVTRSFDVFLICAWINGWVNNREAGDLGRHRAHLDVIVMGGYTNSVYCFDHPTTVNWLSRRHLCFPPMDWCGAVCH